MQPYGCIDDTRWMHKRISNALMARSYIFNTFIQNNVNLTFGSDWDVTPLNPLEGIYDAIKCYTKNNAYAGFQETKLGVLKKDMLADFVVLSKDITRIETSEILKVKVLRTVVGGKDVYELSD